MAAINEMKALWMKSSRGFWLSIQDNADRFFFNFQVANIHRRSISMQNGGRGKRKSLPCFGFHTICFVLVA
jgi:hypothetical protein